MPDPVTPAAASGNAAALFTAAGGIIIGLGGIITKLWIDIKTLKAKTVETAVVTQKTEADLSHQLIGDISSDRKALREEVREYKDEIKGLREEVAALRTELHKLALDVTTQQDGREKAEAQRDAALATATEWEKRFEVEHDIVNSLSMFYNAQMRGRELDNEMLATIKQKLERAGL